MRTLTSLFSLTLIAFVFSGCENVSSQNQDYQIADESELVLAGAEDVGDFELSKIRLPKGFKIELYAEVENARSMVRSKDGTLFVGTRKAGKVFALKDTNGDGRPDKTYTLASGLTMPNGVALKNGDLYVAEVSRILRFEDIENNLKDDAKFEVVYDQYPTERHHGWKYIAFGPDGMLYVPVGAPCNICKSEDEIFASITRIDVDSPKPEVILHGIRNTVGFDWHPETKELWFTDNGRDWMGDNTPPCEFNHAPEFGLHYGYPFCHGGDTIDDEFGKPGDCEKYVSPVQKLGPHVAPLGMAFYTGNKFPSTYKNQPLIAEHGSWNRSIPIGYRVVHIPLDGNKSKGYKVFADGWLNEKTGEPWGRPVDVINLPDGSILVSDDHGGAIYRIWYEG